MAIFGIDLEGVITADPALFGEFIQRLQARGHTAVIVTARSGLEPWRSMTQEYLQSNGISIPVVYADAEWKREAALKAGYKIDIWIDDNPESVAGWRISPDFSDC